MFRTFFLASAVAAIAILITASESSAITISRNNPYRSFNLSGVNYGSVQWEKSHGKSSKSWSSGNTSRRWFRGRR
jgi:hypothetical protein